MDPFLEHPAIFGDLRFRLVVRISAALNATLPEPYYSVINARTWVTLPDDEYRENYVEVMFRHSADEGERRLTRIEVVSAADKTLGTRARELWLRDQQNCSRGMSWLQIDLLRGGQPTIPLPDDRALTGERRPRYCVVLRRLNEPVRCEVWSVKLESRLPVVPVPLLGQDLDVALDLQAVFDECYDTAAYQRRIDYHRPVPPPALPLEEAAWVAQRAQEHTT